MPSARAVGRIGALALTLGVGAAAGTGFASPAAADGPTSRDGAHAGPSATGQQRQTGRSARQRPPSAVARPAAAVKAAAIRRSAAPAMPQVSPGSPDMNRTTPNLPAAPAVWTLLAFARREFERTFLNRYPTINPAITGQTPAGVVTGSLGAVDPDGDRLTYTVVGAPTLGRVSIDQDTGSFTYTPVVDFANGGDDAFTVTVSDEPGLHVHGLHGLLQAPVRLLRAIPFVGSLLSDYLPATDPTATVRVTFDGSGTPTASVFPDDFHWGVSTAGFQSEMGGGAPLDVNSDWWQWTHDPANRLLLGWKGAVPEDGPGAYTQYPTDIALARDGVGADTFRMSIEWSRIFPTSTAAVDFSGGPTPEALEQLDALADQDAVSHYRDVLTAMNTAGLDPMVTVNHFTLPLWVHNPSAARLQEVLGISPQAGGWVSPSTATEFEKYSAYLAWKFGPQVKTWVVLNEPVNSMLTSYYAIPFATNFPPAIFRPDLFAAGLRNEAAAYSASYDLIHQLDGDAQVGFALNMYSWRAANPANPADQRSAAAFSEFYNQWFPDAVVRGEVDANFDGVITADEVHPELAGKADFFGVNYYSQGIVVSYGGWSHPALPIVTGYPEFSPLLNVVAGGCPATECSDTAQIINPAGLRDVLDIADSYGIPLWVTENGVADAADTRRASYTVRHLAVIGKAIADGMDIRGYTAWALTDNLEWVLGYDPRYGLYSYDPVTLVRTPRPSVALIRDIFTGNALSADVLGAYLTDPRNR